MGKAKRYPCQDPALKKARDEIKRLEGSLRKEGCDKEKLRKELERLKEENERLGVVSVIDAFPYERSSRTASTVPICMRR